MTKIINKVREIHALQMRGKVGTEARQSEVPFFGIYQHRHTPSGIINVKEKFYTPTNPQTETQQANRTKLANADKAWQALSEETKNYWRFKTKHPGMTGFNLFIKKYMLDLL